MAVVVQEKAHLRVQFRGARVNPKLWLTYKTIPSGGVVFTCWDRKAAFNMTDEKIEEIKLMMQLLKEQQ